MTLSNGMPFTIIGDDGGYIRTPQTVTAFNIGVTERVDTIIDFSSIPVGTKIVLQNTEQRQPPIGAAPNPNTDGTVMQFTVVAGPSVPPRALPGTLEHHRHADARPADALPDPERPVRRSGPPAAGGARRPAVPRADHGAADDRLDGGLGVHHTNTHEATWR